MKITRNPRSLEDGDTMSFTVIFEGVDTLTQRIEGNLVAYGEKIKEIIEKEIHDDVVERVKETIIMEIVANINKEAITNMATITLAKCIGKEVSEGLVKETK